MCCHQPRLPRMAGKPENLEEARRAFSQHLWGWSTALWPLEFGLPASKNCENKTPAILGHPGDVLSGKPQGVIPHLPSSSPHLAQSPPPTPLLSSSGHLCSLSHWRGPLSPILSSLPPYSPAWGSSPPLALKTHMPTSVPASRTIHPAWAAWEPKLPNQKPLRTASGGSRVKRPFFSVASSRFSGSPLLSPRPIMWDHIPIT